MKKITREKRYYERIRENLNSQIADGDVCDKIPEIYITLQKLYQREQQLVNELRK